MFIFPSSPCFSSAAPPLSSLPPPIRGLPPLPLSSLPPFFFFSPSFFSSFPSFFPFILSPFLFSFLLLLFLFRRGSSTIAATSLPLLSFSPISFPSFLLSPSRSGPSPPFFFLSSFLSLPSFFLSISSAAGNFSQPPPAPPLPQPRTVSSAATYPLIPYAAAGSPRLAATYQVRCRCWSTAGDHHRDGFLLFGDHRCFLPPLTTTITPPMSLSRNFSFSGEEPPPTHRPATNQPPLVRRCAAATTDHRHLRNNKEIEELCSVNSPRRTMSFAKNRKGTTISFPEDNKASGFGVSGEHGPKPLEVYGFVGSITTVVATVMFFIWAYVPDNWLHSVGIFYYPSRYWALAVPAYLIVTAVLAIGLYIGLNFMATPPPTSFSTMFDEFTREPLISIPSMNGEEQPIEPISDIGINQINEIMFKDFK